jgi:hypothetical protein
MRRVTIEWSYPMDIDNILLDERMQDIGIYYITRKFGNNVSNLYIGKTIYSFGSRLESRRWFWTDNYRGRKEVRLGTIVKPKYLNNEELYQLISDVEATLIYLMSDSLIHNNKCTLSCNPSQRIKITNIGYRGDLPPEMYIKDEDWIE